MLLTIAETALYLICKVDLIDKEIEMAMKIEQFVGRPVNEKNDCAVRAFTVVSGLPYMEVWKLFKEAGRQPRKGSTITVMNTVAQKIGLEFKQAKARPTLKQFQQMIGSDPVVAVKRGHAFGYKAGETLDVGTPVGNRTRIWCYYTKAEVPKITYELTAKGQYLLPL